MLDHVFTDAIGAVRAALESAMLERQAFEERFQTDVLLGDTTWETTYGLPGEAAAPEISAVVTLAWPTWSQTAYRTWFLDEDPDEPDDSGLARLVRPLQPLLDEPTGSPCPLEMISQARPDTNRR